jgi:DNA-binding protein YbaB
MRGVDAGNNGGGPSINIDSENVTIADATVREADRSGIDVTAGSEGTVTIERTVVSGGSGGNDFDNAHDGIAVRSGKKLTISDTELTNTQKNGVSVLENSVAAGGRTVVLNNITSEANGNVGVLIDGTTDADSVSIVNSTIRSNDNDGIEIVIETAMVSQTRISNNADAGITFNGAFTGGSINKSSILNNQGPEIINNIDAATVDARNNWWGVPTGPSETEITGEVRVENPLNAPPGTISPLSVAGTVQQSGAPGETARVSYTISNVSDQSSVAINITELPAPVSVNTSASATNGGTFGANGRQVLFSQPAGEQTLTIAYDIDASANATFNVTAEVLDQDSATTDTATVEVGATETGPVARFDADGDGEISLSEVQTAIRAFSNGELDLQGVQQVIAAFSG